jgi:hypothetical protein
MPPAVAIPARPSTPRSSSRVSCLPPGDQELHLIGAQILVMGGMAALAVCCPFLPIADR